MSQKNFFLKRFAPFAALSLGSFYILYEFRKLNYQFPKNSNHIVYREDLKRFGMADTDYQTQTTLSLKDEYEKMMKNMDIDNWENIRGPRPWEDNTAFKQKMLEKAEEKRKANLLRMKEENK
jgi:cytochrome c oxidase assembly protein subunit 16